MPLSRRIVLGGLGATMFAGPAGAQAAAVGPTAGERAAMDAVAEAVLAEFRIPGLSVAIAADGKLAYAQGFGLADRERGEKVTPQHLFRIASVSKPITSVAIFSLIEAGRLSLTDKVFGPGAVLGADYGAPPYQPGIDQITIDHLLTHTSGGWPNDILDPMFSQGGQDHRQLITWVLANQKVEHPPGTHYAYSNFGYCVLGRVIEKVTGERYQDYVRNRILVPCGASDMRIAGNGREQRAAGEVTYYGSSNYGFGFAYNIDVARMDSHGGWIASASSLVRFLVALPGLLRPETQKAMLTPSPLQPTYARGWRVNTKGTHWHTGSLAGTTTLMVRTTHGLCWAVLTNGRERGAGSYTEAIDRMMWDMVRKVPAWRA